MTHVLGIETPIGANLSKLQIAGVAINHVRHRKRRVEENLFARLRDRQLTKLSRALDGVEILCVKQMPIGDQ